MKRKEERELVFKALYSLHMDPNPIDKIIDDVISLNDISGEISEYVKISIANIIKHKDEVDAIIERFLSNWDFKRVSPIDISLLRLAIGEMLYSSDIPPEVSINEVIELSKKYSNDNAPKFINGILDSVLKEEKGISRPE